MTARRQSSDVHEGVASFVEKRPPVFTDHVGDGLPAIAPDPDEPVFF